MIWAVGDGAPCQREAVRAKLPDAGALQARGGAGMNEDNGFDGPAAQPSGDDFERIRQTLSTYTVNGDRRRFKALAATFTLDGVFETPRGTFRGQEAIIEGLSVPGEAPPPDPVLHPRIFTRHNLTTCHIELTGPDTAQARTYFIVYSAIGADHAGVYDDELVRQEDGWRFAKRRVRIDWIHDDTVLTSLLVVIRGAR